MPASESPPKCLWRRRNQKRPPSPPTTTAPAPPARWRPPEGDATPAGPARRLPRSHPPDQTAASHGPPWPYRFFWEAILSRWHRFDVPLGPQMAKKYAGGCLEPPPPSAVGDGDRERRPDGHRPASDAAAGQQRRGKKRSDERRRGSRLASYFPNSLSVAVINPSWGLAAQKAPSFFALASNLSVSNTGGSSSSR